MAGLVGLLISGLLFVIAAFADPLLAINPIALISILIVGPAAGFLFTYLSRRLIDFIDRAAPNVATSPAEMHELSPESKASLAILAAVGIGALLLVGFESLQKDERVTSRECFLRKNWYC